MSSFWSRIAVAVVGIPVVLGLVYLGGWYLFVLIAIAVAVALHEYWLLSRALRPLAPAGYVGGILALVGAEMGGVEWMLGGVLTTLALAFFLKGISEARQAATVAISGTFLGAGWIGLGLGFLLVLRGIPHDGRLLTFTVVLAVWAGDTFAYFGGRLLGRHSMAPTTSPKKTWEGFVFGTAATVFVSFIALYKQDVLTITHSIILGVVLAVAAPLGDLFESLLKRDAGVKDSGSVLGGHGGVLDRLDAFFFAAPAAYFCLAAFGHI
ncbi:MAG TPA: phosphatidate cytidylyltransferase [Gaiellaceae bacterium]|jgi:phosphatidate cytidylyltransferase